jgi:hypothetical protein
MELAHRGSTALRSFAKTANYITSGCCIWLSLLQLSNRLPNTCLLHFKQLFRPLALSDNPSMSIPQRTATANVQKAAIEKMSFLQQLQEIARRIIVAME